jgi:hypothetical protein
MPHGRNTARRRPVGPYFPLHMRIERVCGNEAYGECVQHRDHRQSGQKLAYSKGLNATPLRRSPLTGFIPEDAIKIAPICLVHY